MRYFLKLPQNSKIFWWKDWRGVGWGVVVATPDSPSGSTTVFCMFILWCRVISCRFDDHHCPVKFNLYNTTASACPTKIADMLFQMLQALFHVRWQRKKCICSHFPLTCNMITVVPEDNSTIACNLHYHEKQPLLKFIGDACDVVSEFTSSLSWCKIWSWCPVSMS